MPNPAVIRRQPFIRALGIWLVLIAVEFLHGVLRTIFLVPVVGDFRSRQIGVFSGSVLILAVAYVLVPWLRTTERKPLVLVGFLWLLLTVAFELGFGHFAFRGSWEDLARDYNPVHCGLLPVGLVVLMVAPVIALRMRAGKDGESSLSIGYSDEAERCSGMSPNGIPG